jgi:carbamoyl-phosphate synthase small subunit
MDAIIALEDGTVFRGKGIGAAQTVCGELVFNTAMTGYQEVITDPSYCNQIVVFTYPHIGNTGINLTDYESDKPHLKAIIARDIHQNPMHWQSTTSLGKYLLENNIPAIYAVDTRAITKRLRISGSLNACVMLDDINVEHALELARNSEKLAGLDLVCRVTTDTTYNLSAIIPTKYNIAVIDYGVKHSILNHLRNSGCDLTIFNAKTALENIEIDKFDGFLLSNGPGDPSAVKYGIEFVKELVNFDIPVMGICLGYQILGLALGAKTMKMKFGHHGINHPVKNLQTNSVIITSQNHGFAVELGENNMNLQPTHISLFDGTLQGFSHKEKSIFGFQGHPEAGPGPKDAEELFIPFLTAVEHYKNNSVRHEQKESLIHA